MFSTHAIEGHQGINRFFTSSMRWGDLESKLLFPDQLGELDDDHRMQRGLAKTRIRDLVRYLLEAEDHFFSALTLVILPRDISRPATEQDEDDPEEWDYAYERDPTDSKGQQRLGTLYLSGDVHLFTADGQHRARSAMEALKQNPTLAREEVPVVVVPYLGPDHVRQLFSDLNLNAKPVSRTMGYDFETRDPIAIMAKHVAAVVPLFQGRVNRVSNSLPKSSANVITLNTLVEGSRSILSGLAALHKEGEETTEEARTKLVADREAAEAEVAQVWETITNAFSDEWAPVFAGEEGAAGAVREDYVFAYGLGWLALSRAAARLMEEFDGDWEERFLKAIASFDWHRTATTWLGNAVLYNEETGAYRVNNTGPAISEMAERIVAAARDRSEEEA